MCGHGARATEANLVKKTTGIHVSQPPSSLNDADLGVLASTIREAHKGGGAFDGFLYGYVRAILVAGFGFRRNVPEPVYDIVARQGINLFVEQKDTSGHVLRAALFRAEEEYLAQVVANYVYVTSASLELRHTLKRSVGAARIAISQRWPREIVEARKQITERRCEDTASADGYACVAVTVSARSPFEAGNYAQYSFDLLRSLWNFSINQRLVARMFAEGGTPINDITLGECHTLHKPDLAPAMETFWFDSTFRNRPPKRLSTTEWRQMRREEVRTWRSLRALAYAETMSDAFVRYGRALDAVDHEGAFLKLWSLLELLTRTEAERNDQTIRRTLAIFSDDPLARIGLEQLRRQRNLSVHHDSVAGQTEGLLFQLKFYVESLMRVHLGIGAKMRSLDEMGAFLQLPKDSTTLLRQIELRQAGIAFHKPAGG